MEFGLKIEWPEFMIRCLFILLLSLFIQEAAAQVEKENYNPLPPGPARISGCVLNEQGAIEQATVRLEYILNGIRQHRDFQTFGQGEYTVYINENAKDAVILVLVKDEVMLRYEPEYYHEGSVQRKDLILE